MLLPAVPFPCTLPIMYIHDGDSILDHDFCGERTTFLAIFMKHLLHSSNRDLFLWPWLSMTNSFTGTWNQMCTSELPISPFQLSFTWTNWEYRWSRWTEILKQASGSLDRAETCASMAVAYWLLASWFHVKKSRIRQLDTETRLILALRTDVRTYKMCLNC